MTRQWVQPFYGLVYLLVALARSTSRGAPSMTRQRLAQLFVLVYLIAAMAVCTWAIASLP